MCNQCNKIDKLILFFWFQTAVAPVPISRRSGSTEFRRSLPKCPLFAVHPAVKKPEAETICFRLEIRVNQLVLPGKLPPWEGWVGVVEFSEEELLDVSCRTPVSVTSTSIV